MAGCDGAATTAETAPLWTSAEPATLRVCDLVRSASPRTGENAHLRRSASSQTGENSSLRHSASPQTGENAHPRHSASPQTGENAHLRCSASPQTGENSSLRRSASLQAMETGDGELRRHSLEARVERPALQQDHVVKVESQTTQRSRRYCRSCCGGWMTGEQWLVFWLCGAVNFGASASVATMAPFFPQEAEGRGLTSTNAALVFSIYSVAALLISPLMTKLVPYMGPKNVFLAGSVLVGTGNLAFGSLVHVEDLTAFTTLCLVVRVLMGAGSAANITATYTYVSGLFPERVAATLGMLEVFTALGTCAGPALGGLLFALGGYSIPFYSVGAFILLLLPINICSMPAIEAESRTSHSIRPLLACFPVYVVLGAVAMVTMVFGFTEATMARHLYHRFGLDPRTIGLVFLMFAVAYGLASPLVGCLSDVIAHRTPLIGCALMTSAVVTLCFAPPELVTFMPRNQLWVALLCLCLAAALLAAAMVPAFGVLLHIAKGPAGLANDVSTDALVSAAFQTFFYVGYVVGPALGGFLVDGVGFPNTVGIISAILFCWGLLTLLTGLAMACRGWQTAYHTAVPTDQPAASPARKWSVSSAPPPQPSSPAVQRARADRRLRLHLSSRHSAPAARDSGGYRSFQPEVGSLSPPPARAVRVEPAPLAAAAAAHVMTPAQNTIAQNTQHDRSVSGSRRVGSWWGSRSSGLNGSKWGSRSGSKLTLESAQEREELKIAELIKNADLAELQELLKSPVEGPPADLPWS